MTETPLRETGQTETSRSRRQKPSRKRRWGDRPDGRLLRTLDPLNRLMPYIMNTRSGSTNYFHAELDIRAAERYIRQKRVDGLKGFGILHFFIAAYVRVLSQRPGINRFIAGQKTYARHNIEVNFTMKKELTLSGQETVVKIICQPTDTAADIFRHVTAAIQEARQVGDSNDVDDTARILGKLPGFVMKFLVWVLKKMDYFGIMPRSIREISPFHGSLFITDLGSINLPPVDHHLYEFGNIPLFISIGPKQKETILDKHGQPFERRFLAFTLSLDERIADGFYFSGIFRMLKELFANPERLEYSPEQVAEDVE